MEAYTGFAEVYDLFMDNVPYQEWSKYLVSLLQEYQVSEGLVLELGCGTGKMTRLLAQAGYDMIGVDNSQEMLQIAKLRVVDDIKDMEQENADILYLLQDMREFELYGTVKAVISVCDSINYILEEEDLRKVFQLVNNYLDPGGVFIFDLNTLYKYREILGESTFCENRKQASFIWENYYDHRDQINQYDLTLFVREPDSGELYRKYEEIHFQRGYELRQVQELLVQAGLEFVTAYDAFSRAPVRADSERIYVIAREKDKLAGREYNSRKQDMI
ncbi:MAG: methyltransferase domain-containing protein [Lachnospiraceae bacterium]|nr:methyltransferase domain-containing protein [Lachnospiraceae bacterium]